MDYENLKKELLSEANLILKEYKEFATKVKELSKKIGHPINLTEVEKINYRIFLNSNEDIKKFLRLSLSLLYTENPKDEEIYTALLDNIETYKVKNDELILNKDDNIKKR